MPISFFGAAATEVKLDTPEPYVIQLYPHRISREAPSFFAWQLAYALSDRKRRGNKGASFVSEQSMYLFRNFLVLVPGVSQAEAERVRDILEAASRARWNGEYPYPEHVLLLDKEEARRKPSFFRALVDELRSDRAEKAQKDLACVLIAKFFHGHPAKMRDLAQDVAYLARHGGRHYGGED